MKQFLLILLTLLCMNIGYGQIVEDGKIFSKVEVTAEFPGGNAAWMRYLQNNIDPNAPDSTAPRGIHNVLVVFEIDIDGTISNAYCENDPGHGMCQEAIRVIRKSPKWSPAKVDDKFAKSLKRQQIGFSIE